MDSQYLLLHFKLFCTLFLITYNTLLIIKTFPYNFFLHFCFELYLLHIYSLSKLLTCKSFLPFRTFVTKDSPVKVIFTFNLITLSIDDKGTDFAIELRQSTDHFETIINLKSSDFFSFENLLIAQGESAASEVRLL